MSQLSVSGKRIVVLGGGVAGLSFVHYLRVFAGAYNKGDAISRITLLEANHYMGGSIKTKHWPDGPAHELGPRSVRTIDHRGFNTLALVDQLGLTDQLVTPSESSAGRYIYHGNKMHLMPAKLNPFVRIPGSNKRMFRAGLTDWRAPKMDVSKYPEGDPPLYDFVAHRFGEVVADCVASTILRGITSGDARHTSTDAIIGEILAKEQHYGSVLRSISKPPVNQPLRDELIEDELRSSPSASKFMREKIVSFNLKCGLQTIPEYLSNALLNTNEDGKVDIFNESRVAAVKFDTKFEDDSPAVVDVKTIEGDHVRVEADHVVSAIPAKNLAEILPDTTPAEQMDALADVLKIPHVPVGCVCIEYHGMKDKPQIMNSFGFLAHPNSDTRLLGISFDSSIFDQIDRPFKTTRLTCMMGGAWFEQVFGTTDPSQVSDAQLEQIALEEVRSILKLTDEPRKVTPYMWKVGIAQYRPGHRARLARVRAELQRLQLPLTLLGQSYDGFAVNDVIYASRLAAYNYVKSL